MSVLPAVEHFLQKKSLTFNFCRARNEVDSDKLVNAVFISDGGKVILTVYPSSHVIDFELLRERTKRQFELVYPDSRKFSLRGMQLKNLFPVAEWYGVSAIIEKSLLEQDELFLPAGDNMTNVQMDRQNAANLFRSAIPLCFSTKRDCSVGREADKDVYDLLIDACAQSQSLALVSEKQLDQRIRDITHLPSAMNHASDLIALMADPDLSARELGEFAERDPLMAVSLIKHASAPYYGYRGRLVSASDAIMHVLGVENSLNLLLSYVFSGGANMPVRGRAGRRSILEYSVRTARAMEKLSATPLFEGRIEKKSAYLTGLLRGTGYFITSHRFTEAYEAFNRLISERDEMPLDETFKQIFTACPVKASSWFLNSWQVLPDTAAILARYDDLVSPGEMPVLDMLRIASSDFNAALETPVQRVLNHYRLTEDDVKQLLSGSEAEAALNDQLVEALIV